MRIPELQSVQDISSSSCRPIIRWYWRFTEGARSWLGPPRTALLRLFFFNVYPCLTNPLWSKQVSSVSSDRWSYNSFGEFSPRCQLSSPIVLVVQVCGGCPDRAPKLKIFCPVVLQPYLRLVTFLSFLGSHFGADWAPSPEIQTAKRGPANHPVGLFLLLSSLITCIRSWD